MLIVSLLLGTPILRTRNTVRFAFKRKSLPYYWEPKTPILFFPWRALYCSSMAFKKTLAERLFRISKISNQSLSNCRISSPAVQTRIPQNPSKSNISPDPGDNGIFRRLFHKGAVLPSSNSPELLSMQIGESLVDKLRSFDIAKNRIKLDGLIPPAIKYPDESRPEKEGLTVEDARKLLRAAQLEVVKSRLRGMENSWTLYPEFVRICGEGCSDLEQGIRIAKTLDESGTVIVLGNVVFLKPEQVNLSFTT